MCKYVAGKHPLDLPVEVCEQEVTVASGNIVFRAKFIAKSVSDNFIQAALNGFEQIGFPNGLLHKRRCYFSSLDALTHL